MERISVISSTLKSIGYDPASKTLEIEFLAKGPKQSVYTYHPVTAAEYAELMTAPSIGGWFSAHIKNNLSISYKRVETTEETI